MCQEEKAFNLQILMQDSPSQGTGSKRRKNDSLKAIKVSPFKQYHGVIHPYISEIPPHVQYLLYTQAREQATMMIKMKMTCPHNQLQS